MLLQEEALPKANFIHTIFQIGQENLNDVTKGTLNRLTSGHRGLIKEQVRIRNEFGNVNKDLTAKMNENMVALEYEKRIIKEAEQQLSSMTEAIATTLGKGNTSSRGLYLNYMKKINPLIVMLSLY